MKYLTSLLSLFLAFFLFQGCSVYMAASQPEKIDLATLEELGMPRDHVITKLGAPTSSTKNENGTRTDVFEFYEGSVTGWKVGRATFNVLADIVTLGLWEVVATPTEVALKGQKITAIAAFDQNDLLTEFRVLGRVEAEEPEEVDQEAEDELF